MAGSKGDDFGDRQAMADLHQAVNQAAAALHNIQGSKLTMFRHPCGTIDVEIGYSLVPSCDCGCPCDALPVAGLGGPGLLSGAAANDVEPPPPAPSPYSEKMGFGSQRLKAVA